MSVWRSSLFMFMTRDRGLDLTPGCYKLLNNVEKRKEKPVGGLSTDAPKASHSLICILLIYTSRKQAPPVCVLVCLCHMCTQPLLLWKQSLKVVGFEEGWWGGVWGDRNVSEPKTELQMMRNQRWKTGDGNTVTWLVTNLSIKFNHAESIISPYWQPKNTCQSMWHGPEVVSHTLQSHYIAEFAGNRKASGQQILLT